MVMAGTSSPKRLVDGLFVGCWLHVYHLLLVLVVMVMVMVVGAVVVRTSSPIRQVILLGYWSLNICALFVVGYCGKDIVSNRAKLISALDA